MDAFLDFSSDDRREAFRQAEAQLGLRATAIEKDFWVCWTLRELFGLPELGPHFTFKGGTSLSKAWRLIERFSEDIDVVIERDFLGFGGERSPERATSRNKQRERLAALRGACRSLISESLTPVLTARIGERWPARDDWSLEADPGDPDAQTLLFQYPAVFPEGAYVRPVVKIELGARSDTEPTETPEIQPYLAEALPQLLGPSRFALRTVAARRTFWEKAMLLHEETYRPADRQRAARLSRHYYDLWCLIRKGVGEQAFNDRALFERVAAHRAFFFRHGWMDYSTLRKGSLRLVPSEDLRPEWQQDYTAMREAIFFGEAPEFTEILGVIGDFERRFNERP
jgi:hypothetical protein